MSTTFRPVTAAVRRAAQATVRCAYARLSVEEARSNSVSIARQVESFKLVDPEMKVFIDDGVSGTKSSRPQFDQMLAYVREEEVTELYVARLDRLGRNHDLKNLLPSLYHESGVRVICTEEDSPDLSSDIGRLLFDLRCNLACSESDRIGARQRAARERVYREHRQTRARSGYLLVDGGLVPDDLPRHCPLQQRREVTGRLDRWGIAEDAFPGFSNFEITALPVKMALRYRNWGYGYKWACANLLLTEAGAWDPDRERYVAHPPAKEIQEILVSEGEPCVTRRLLQGTVPASYCVIVQRAQNPTFHGHFYGRRNWDAEDRPSLNSKRAGYSRYDEDTYEFFEHNAHVSMLSEEDLKALDEMNAEVRAAKERGQYGPGGGQYLLDMNGPEQLQHDLFLTTIRRCRCKGCGGRMRAMWTRSNYNKGVDYKRYYYATCYQKTCPYGGLRVNFENIVAGLTMHLAAYSASVQAGEAEPIRERPAQLSKLQELEADYAEYASKRRNTVRDNILRLLKQEIDQINAGVVSADKEFKEVVAYRRFGHPRATEPGAWLELLAAGSDLMRGVLSLVRWIDVAVAEAPVQPAKARVGRRRKSAWGEVVAVTTVTEA